MVAALRTWLPPALLAEDAPAEEPGKASVNLLLKFEFLDDKYVEREVAGGRDAVRTGLLILFVVISIRSLRRWESKRVAKRQATASG